MEIKFNGFAYFFFHIFYNLEFPIILTFESIMFLTAVMRKNNLSNLIREFKISKSFKINIFKF